MFKTSKYIIPLIIVTLFIGINVFRWEKEITIKPRDNIQMIYKKDRWTGQRWIIEYQGNNVVEKPIIDSYILKDYAGNIKNRADIIQAYNDRFKKADTNYKTYLANNENETFLFSKAQEELSTKAWEKRKKIIYIWWGLFSISLIWLIINIIYKNKKI